MLKTPPRVSVPPSSAEACPARTFTSSATATACTNCPTGCAACTSASACSQCDVNYRMNNGSCGELPACGRRQWLMPT